MSNPDNIPQAPEQPKLSVLDLDDIAKMSPALGKHPRLVNFLLKLIKLDKINDLHARCVVKPGGAPGFARHLLEDLDIKLRIDNEQVLDNLPEGAFVTVSNHHFGALDGIILMDIIGSRRPDYKIMVNMILNHIGGMRSNFIAVDPLASDDPAKKAVSMKGIKETIIRIRQGHPVGFFPAGAVGKINWRGRLKDLPWQSSIMRLIEQYKVPVIPIFFHGSQSWLFNILGVTAWQLRTLRHPAEMLRKRHKTFHITVGQPISVEEQLAHMNSLEEFTAFLRSRTYELRDSKKQTTFLVDA